MITGYYNYYVPDYTLPRRLNGLPGLKKERVRVEILKEDAKHVTVRFLKTHADGRGFGTITRVKKSSVSKDSEFIERPVTYWLPYKD